MTSMPMKLVSTYTIEEAWTSDSNGNAQIAWDTIMKPAIEGDNEATDGMINIYIGIFTNNTVTGNYSADYMMFYGAKRSSIGDGAQQSYFATVRNGRTNISVGAGTSRSLRVSAGTVVKIYRVFTP